MSRIKLHNNRSPNQQQILQPRKIKGSLNLSQIHYAHGIKGRPNQQQILQPRKIKGSLNLSQIHYAHGIKGRPNQQQILQPRKIKGSSNCRRSLRTRNQRQAEPSSKFSNHTGSKPGRTSSKFFNYTGSIQARTETYSKPTHR